MLYSLKPPPNPPPMLRPTLPNNEILPCCVETIINVADRKSFPSRCRPPKLSKPLPPAEAIQAAAARQSYPIPVTRMLSSTQTPAEAILANVVC